MKQDFGLLMFCLDHSIERGPKGCKKCCRSASLECPLLDTLREYGSFLLIVGMGCLLPGCSGFFEGNVMLLEESQSLLNCA